MNLATSTKILATLIRRLPPHSTTRAQPDNPNAHMNLGGIYRNLGNLDQALASSLKSLELKPDSPTAHMNLGGIYRDLGKLDQALASTSNHSSSNRITPMPMVGRIYKDLDNLDQALASSPNHSSSNLIPHCPHEPGSIYKDLDNLIRFASIKSLELKPDNPTAHMNLGSIYKDLGNLDQALASTLK